MSKKSQTRRKSRPFASQVEGLEARVLLAGDTVSEWQNPLNPYDVNQDSHVSAVDVLAVTRTLNTVGSHQLPARAAAEPGSSDGTNSLMIDPSGDGFVSPIDALMVVEAIDAAGEGEEYRVRLEVTDANGDPVSQVNKGDTFTLNAYVEDLRGAEEPGVFAVYTDVTYDDSLVSVASGASLVHADPYSDGTFGDVSQPGLLDEVGGFDQSASHDGSEQLFFQLEFVADAAGTVSFQADPADVIPAHEFLVNDSLDAVPGSNIDFGGVDLTVVDDSQPAVVDLASFAQALDNAGVQFWSTRQANAVAVNQRALFEDADYFLPFQESLDVDGNINAAATAVNVTEVNTWIFPDETRATGLLTLEELSTRSGVAIPENNGPTLKPITSNGLLTLEEGSPLQLPIDAYDATNGPLTYTITVQDPALVEATEIMGNRSWELEIENYGTMLFEFFEGRANRATDQFISLTENGFYDGLTFHRVIDEFVIQGGDPLGDGTGGSDLPDFDDQFHVDLQHNQVGVLSMAKSGDDTNNSQFFITDAETRHLDFNHTIFGQLVEGFEILDAVSAVSTDGSDLPDTPVVITSAMVVDDPENAIVMLKALGATGSTDVTVTVTDALGNSDSQTFQVDLTADREDAQPFLYDFPNYVVPTDSFFTFPLDYVDAEGDAADFDMAVLSPDTVTGEVSDTGLVTLDIPDTLVDGDEIEVIVRVSDSAADDQRITLLIGEDIVADDDDFTIDEDTGPHTFSVLDNDTGSNFTITSVSTPSEGGTVEITANNEILYTPAPNFPISSTTAKDEVFTYTITSADSELSSVGLVTVTVNPVNDPPTANDDAYPANLNPATDVERYRRLREDSVEAANLFVLLNDLVAPDEEIPGISAVDSQSGATLTITNLNAAVDYVPAANFFGTDTFTYTLTDPGDLSDMATVTVQIAQVNDAPTTVDDSLDVIAGQAQSFDASVLLGNDSAGPLEDTIQTLSLDSVTQPANGTVTINADGTFTYTANAGFSGTDTFTYTAIDDGITEDFDDTSVGFVATADPLTAAGSVTVNVTAAMIAVDDSFDVPGNLATVSLDVLANDDLTLSPSITATTDPANGSVAIINNGSDISYTKDTGFVGTDTFTYTITDSEGADFTATVTLNVQASNLLPTALDDTFTVPSNGTASTLDVLANDSVEAGESKTITAIMDQPNHGVVTIDNGNVLLYTPNDGFVGTDLLVYQMDDGNGGTDSAQVTITVESTNVLPVAMDDVFVFSGTATRTLDVLANDTTEDGETLTISSLVTVPSNGVATIASDGLTIEYEWIDDIETSDSLVYEINDGNGGTATATVTISRTANENPVAMADSFNVTLRSELSFDVLDNDTTEDGETLSVAAITVAPTLGTATVASDGLSILYTPGSNGTDTLTYEISDGNGGTATAQVTVTVDIVNQLPVAMDDSLTIDAGGAQTLDVLANDTTEDGETLTIDAITVSPTLGTAELAADGRSILYTANAGASGTDTLTYQISDGNGGTDTAQVTLTVDVPNLDPTATDDVLTVVPYGQQTLAVLTNDTTEAGETLTILSTGTALGNLAISSDGTSLLYTPAADSAGTTDTFTYQISDGNGGTAEASVTVNIQTLDNSFFSGVVFQDMDNDGVQGSDEHGIGGVTVVLEGTDVAGEPVRMETQTSLQGVYRFESIAPGDYTVSQVQPPFLSSGSNTLMQTVTATDSASFQVSDSLISSDDNTFGEQGLLPQFAMLDAISSSRQPSVFVVLDGDDLAWLESRQGWEDIDSLFVTRDGDSLLIESSDGSGTLAMSDRTHVQLLGSSGQYTLLRIVGTSEDVLSAAAVDAALAG